MAQGVKDTVLSLLWCGFDTWPGNFCMLQAQPKGRWEKKKEREREMMMTRTKCSGKTNLWHQESEQWLLFVEFQGFGKIIETKHGEVSGLLIIFYFFMWVLGKFTEFCENQFMSCVNFCVSGTSIHCFLRRNHLRKIRQKILSREWRGWANCLWVPSYAVRRTEVKFFSVCFLKKIVVKTT